MPSRTRTHTPLTHERTRKHALQCRNIAIAFALQAPPTTAPPRQQAVIYVSWPGRLCMQPHAYGVFPFLSLPLPCPCTRSHRLREILRQNYEVCAVRGYCSSGPPAVACLAVVMLALLVAGSDEERQAFCVSIWHQNRKHKEGVKCFPQQPAGPHPPLKAPTLPRNTAPHSIQRDIHFAQRPRAPAQYASNVPGFRVCV